MKNFFLVLILLACLGSRGQTNGIVIVADFKSMGECNSDTTHNTIKYNIRKDIMRVDIRGATANSSIIYQPSSDKIWVLFHHEAVYYSMTGAEMDSLEAKVEYKSREYQRGLDSMDSTQRQQIQMIWPEGNPFLFENPDYELVRKKDSLISQLICHKYLGTYPSGNREYMYTSDLKTTGIKDDELEILKDFSVFMGKGVKALSGNMDFASINETDVGGYPILIENYSGDILCSKYWLKSIYRKQLPNDYFVIPLAFGKFDNPLGN